MIKLFNGRFIYRVINTDVRLTGGAELYSNEVKVINSSGAIVANIQDSLASGKIYVGSSGGVASEVTPTGDVTISNAGVTAIASGVIVNADINSSAAITRQKLSTPAAAKSSGVVSATIATTGNTDAYIVVPETGTISSIDFSGVDVLAAHDSNYITFSVTNLGQAGAGSTVILAATDANTTKATGGTALAANTKRALTLTATGGDLAVTQGDRLLVRAAATGTLANTVTFPAYCIRYSGTT